MTNTHLVLGQGGYFDEKIRKILELFRQNAINVYCFPYQIMLNLYYHLKVSCENKGFSMRKGKYG